MDSIDTLIVGAGPTGLGAAWRLSTHGHSDWLVCEATPSPGGLASSVLDEHGFTWDLGGHVQFSHYEYFDELMDELLGPDGWWEHERESWVWMRDRFVPYPFQMNLHRLPVKERWDCVRGLVRAFAASESGGQESPRDFDGWILATFGEGIADTFLRPYNFKVWAYPPIEMAWNWIGERVAVPDLERVLRNVVLEQDDVSWGPNNTFRFPKRGGTGAIWQALATKLQASDSGQFHFSRALVGLDTSSRVAHFSDKSTVRYRRLVSTIPLDRLVAMSDRQATLGEATEGLIHSSTHVVGVGLRGQPPPHLSGKCWMYFPESNCPFYRVTVFSHYAPSNVPDASNTWSLMAEVSESPEKPVDASTVEDDTVRGLLATSLVSDVSHVSHTWHRRLEYGYPTPSLHRDQALAGLLPALDRCGVYSRGRFGAWRYEVSNQDHSMAQGVELVDSWLKGTPEETLNHPEVVNARRPTRGPSKARGSR